MRTQVIQWRGTPSASQLMDPPAVARLRSSQANFSRVLSVSIEVGHRCAGSHEWKYETHPNKVETIRKWNTLPLAGSLYMSFRICSAFQVSYQAISSLSTDEGMLKLERQVVATNSVRFLSQASRCQHITDLDAPGSASNGVLFNLFTMGSGAVFWMISVVSCLAMSLQ